MIMAFSDKDFSVVSWCNALRPLNRYSDSAVTVTHVPSGVSENCDRSRHRDKNIEIAKALIISGLEKRASETMQRLIQLRPEI